MASDQEGYLQGVGNEPTEKFFTTIKRLSALGPYIGKAVQGSQLEHSETLSL